jgi:hypothetical protein
MTDVERLLVRIIDEARKMSKERFEEHLYEYTKGNLLERWAPEIEKIRKP